MFDNTLCAQFPVGSFLAYYNHPDNAVHHQSSMGQFIEYGQSLKPGADPRVTHISLIEGFDPANPQPGFTHGKIMDIMKGQEAGSRPLEHNYAYWVFHLRPDAFVHAQFSSKTLSEKAIEVARKLKGAPYHRGTLGAMLWSEYKVDAHYLQYLVDRFQINFEKQTFKMIDSSDGFICAEFAMASYQIAWLLLSGKEAVTQSLPPCLNIHALCTPATLTKHLAESRSFVAVPDRLIHALRYSGTPDPRDPPVPNFRASTLSMWWSTQPFPPPPIYQHDSSSVLAARLPRL